MPTDFPSQQQLNAFSHGIGSVAAALPRIALAAALILIGAVVIRAVTVFVLRLLNVRKLLKQKTVLLQLIPPAFSDKTPLATQELFNRLHGWNEIRLLRDKLLRQEATFATEIFSTREGGIGFGMRVPEEARASFEKDIASLSSEVRIQEIKDYLPAKLDSRNSMMAEFKMAGRSFAYPLQFRDSLFEHDPVGSLTSAMTSLQPGEIMVVQGVLSPVNNEAALALARKLLHNEVHMDQMGGSTRRSFARGLLDVIAGALMGITEMAGEIHSGPSDYAKRSQQSAALRHSETAAGTKPARSIGPIEQEIANAANDKLNQPLFRASLRVMVMSASTQSRKEKINDVRKSLGSLRTNYQSLRMKSNFPFGLAETYRTFMFRNRLPAVFRKSSCLFSSSEVAGIFHFPHSQSARTDNVVKSLSRTLPAPPVIRQRGDNGLFDVMLGQNVHHGQLTNIGLTIDERQRHLYILGGTGNGKTTMLFYCILQDIRAGKGIAILDPHGDLAERILHYIPEDRINDVIYMNPDDLAHPIGVNLLELPEGMTGDDLLREKDLITEATISVLRKIFSEDDSGGHRIEYVLRNSIQTALTLENPTLFTIFELLNNAKFRRKVVKTLTDPNLKDFWDNELGKAGEFQRVKMAAGITAKIGRFLFSASARRVLEQPKSTINFEDIIASNKILICNFSKGMLGEDTSTLFGTTVLAKMQTAALRRARIGEQNRVPFYLYVDEFQNFATTSFVQMLSEARKYKLFLTMAEQSTSQQDEQRLVDIILANVGTIVCFRSGSPADERLVLPLFSPFIDQGEIANLPAYSYYVRIAAVDVQEPMSGVTIVVEDKGNEAIGGRVITSSRLLYARKLMAEKPEAIMEDSRGKQKTIQSASTRPAHKQSDELRVASPLK